jgi:hypothetical protein
MTFTGVRFGSDLGAKNKTMMTDLLALELGQPDVLAVSPEDDQT